MVRITILYTAVSLMLAALAMDATADRLHLPRAHVTFLATGTSVHGSLGESQDVYLIEITEGESDQPVLARLIDEYPPDRSALPPETVTSGGTLKVRRDRRCDIAIAQMPIRTAPGDPMAILPERLGFKPHLPRKVAASEVLPCYRTAR